MGNARDESAPIGTDSAPNGISAYLRAEFGDAANGAKTLARLAKCAVGTARKYIYGKRIPRGDTVCELLTHPRFRDGFLKFLDATQPRRQHELAARIASLRTELEWIEQSLRQKDAQDANTPRVSTVGLAMHAARVRTPRRG